MAEGANKQQKNTLRLMGLAQKDDKIYSCIQPLILSAIYLVMMLADALYFHAQNYANIMS